MKQNTERKKNRSAATVRFTLFIAAVVLIIFLATMLDVQQLLQTLLARIAEAGIWGPLVFIGLYILSTVLFLPGSILTLGAGFVFGVIPGTIYVSIASTIGASAAFLLGRTLARDLVRKRVERNERFAAVDDAVGREGWKIVLLTRLSPVFPFNLLNYAYGLTGVSFTGYFFASWLGMLPGTVMYVYIGSLAASLTTLGQERTRAPLEWTLYVLGLLATVIVTILVTRLARRALQQRVTEQTDKENRP